MSNEIQSKGNVLAPAAAALLLLWLNRPKTA